MQMQLFHRFAPAICALSEADLRDVVALQAKFLMAEQGRVRVCYAPFEYLNSEAKLVIVGITPGRTQMVNALREAGNQLKRDADSITALRAAKRVAAFSGAMRPNLIALLDCIGIPQWLGVESCSKLFDEEQAGQLIQTASALRNPVFLDGENYNGTPNMIRNPLLRQRLLEDFGSDISSLRDAVFLPLGDKVSEALHFLADQGRLERSHILDGLPHPSGPNAERIAYFLGRKDRGALSAKTDPHKLDQARGALMRKVAAFS
jgi:hypothetical protein